MKLSLDITFPILALMTCVELFDLVTARPASIPQGKKDLHILYQHMHKLWNTISSEKPENEFKDFEQSLTSLPSVNFRTEDLESPEVSSTLAQLSSGLKSFKFHLDWIQQESDEMDDKSNALLNKIAHQIQVISALLTRIGMPPSEIVHPSLPPLKTAWSLLQAKVEIYEKLYHFCHWYTRALRVLKNSQ